MLFEELTWRGLVHQVTDPALAGVLAGEPVVAYGGFDPTSDSLHVGNLVLITTLMRLEQAGHRVIALAGGGTGMIGDPSGRQEERLLLTTERLEANVAAIRAQLARFLDFGPGGAMLLGKLRKGDLLVVRWVDRLGRNYEDVTDTIRVLMRRG